MRSRTLCLLVVAVACVVIPSVASAYLHTLPDMGGEGAAVKAPARGWPGGDFFPNHDPDYIIVNLSNNAYTDYTAGDTPVFPDGYYLMYPCFNADGTRLAVVARTKIDGVGDPYEIWVCDYDASTHTISNPVQLTSTGGTGDVDSNIMCSWSRTDSDLLLFLEAHVTQANLLKTYDFSTSTFATLYDPALDTNGYDATNPGFYAQDDTKIIVGTGYGTGNDRIILFDGTYPSTTISSADQNLDPSSSYDGTRVSYYSTNSAYPYPAGSIYSAYSGGVWTENVNGWGDPSTGNVPGLWAYYSGESDDQILSLRSDLGWTAGSLSLYASDGTLLSDLTGDAGTDFQWIYANHGWKGPGGEIVFRAEEYTHTGYGNNLFLALPHPSTVWVDDDWTGPDNCGGHSWGYDAYATIQDGIDAVSGSTVNVAAGTYPEQLVINKSLSLIGAGATATLIEPGAYPVINVTANDVTISDLAIADPSEVAEGIQVNSTANLTLTRVDFPNIGAGAGPNSYGVHLLADFTGLTVTDCEFAGSAASSGVSTRNIGIFTPNSLALGDFSISGCTFDEMWTSIYLRSGIDGLEVTGCTFLPIDPEDCTACVAGIYIGDGDDDDFDLRNISVTGNTFTEYGRGVYVWNYGANSTVEDFVISGNTFANTGWSSAIRFIFGLNGMEDYSIDGLDINNNTFTQDSDCGGNVALIDLRTYDATLLTCDVSVTDNVMTFTGAPYADAMYGVQFFLGGDGFYNTTVARNGIDGGSTGGAGTVPASGIRVYHYADAGTWPHTLDLDIVNNVITGFDHGLSVYDAVDGAYGGLPAGTDVAISGSSIVGDVYAIRNDDGVGIDAEGNWWGDATGPYHSTNSGGLGSEVSDYVDFDPWIGKAGSENIVCDPDPLTLNIASGPGTIDVDYLGGGGGMVYGYSVTVTYNPAIATLTGVTQGNLLSDAGATTFFVYGPAGSKTIDCALRGTEPGVTGPGELFELAFTAAGSGVSTVNLGLVAFRDNANNTLYGFYEDDGLINVDVTAPVFTSVEIENLTLGHTDEYVKNGDNLKLSAVVGDDYSLVIGDIKADLSSLLSGGGSAVVAEDYTAGVATWTTALAGVTLTGDGLKTVTVTATDWLGNDETGDDTITVDNTRPTAITGFNMEPRHEGIVMTWDDPSDTDDNFYGVVVRYNDWDDYPEYATPPPIYPLDPETGGEGDLYNDAGLVMTWDASKTDRDISYASAFVYDYALNYGPDDPGAQDRSTNYWLGDVAAGLGVWGYNGEVTAADIGKLGGNYGSAPPVGVPGYSECDVGPTDDNTRLGIPGPDNSVDFDDLMIFAMNYGVVAPRIVPFLAEPSVGELALALNEAGRSSDAVLRLALRLEGNVGEVKGLSTELEYDGLEFLSAGLSDEMNAPVADVFFWSDAASRSAQIDLAVLGTDVTIGGSGDVAVLTFQITDEAYTVDFASAVLRGAANDELTADLEGLSYDGVPASFKLVRNTPNPFNPVTTVGYHLPSESRVTIRVFDVTGRVVTTLVDGVVEPGRHTVVWNGTNEYGESVGSGVYFCTMETPEYRGSHKMTLLK